MTWQELVFATGSLMTLMVTGMVLIWLTWRMSRYEAMDEATREEN
jgi:hypothetical protein